ESALRLGRRSPPPAVKSETRAPTSRLTPAARLIDRPGIRIFLRGLPRPLPPCGAGEEDFQLDVLRATRAGPLPPCVAGERDSKARKFTHGMPFRSAPVAAESDSPAGQAGRGRNSQLITSAASCLPKKTFIRAGMS